MLLGTKTHSLMLIIVDVQFICTIHTDCIKNNINAFMFSVHHTMSNHVYIHNIIFTYIEVSLNYIIFYTLFHYTHYNTSLLTRVWHSQLSSMCPGGLTGQSQRPPIEACSVASTTVRVRWATASANRRRMALAELVHHLLYLTHPLVKLHQQLYVYTTQWLWITV